MDLSFLRKGEIIKNRIMTAGELLKKWDLRQEYHQYIWGLKSKGSILFSEWMACLEHRGEFWVVCICIILYLGFLYAHPCEPYSIGKIDLGLKTVALCSSLLVLKTLSISLALLLVWFEINLICFCQMLNCWSSMSSYLKDKTWSILLLFMFHQYFWHLIALKRS